MGRVLADKDRHIVAAIVVGWFCKNHSSIHMLGKEFQVIRNISFRRQGCQLHCKFIQIGSLQISPGSLQVRLQGRR